MRVAGSMQFVQDWDRDETSHQFGCGLRWIVVSSASRKLDDAFEYVQFIWMFCPKKVLWNLGCPVETDYMSIWDLVVPCIFKCFQMQSWWSWVLPPFPAKHLPSPRNPSFSYPEAFQVPPDSHPVRKKCCFGGGSYLQRNRNWLQILDMFCSGNLQVFLEPFFLRRSCRLLNVMYIFNQILSNWSNLNTKTQKVLESGNWKLQNLPDIWRQIRQKGRSFHQM